MSRLAIFDIDGTLTDTNDVDDDCYRHAVAETLGVAPHMIDWSEATHFSDSGIFTWLCNAPGRSIPSADAMVHGMALARTRFIDRITTALTHDPSQFTAIAGAAEALPAIEDAGWRIAVATGGWGPSARLKLRAAGLVVNDALFACADDAMPRVEIVQLARRRAEAFYQCDFERVVAIGDGRWDVEAAAELGLSFIGIGAGERAAMLRAAGASDVLADYTDIDALLRALKTALVP